MKPYLARKSLIISTIIVSSALAGCSNGPEVTSEDLPVQHVARQNTGPYRGEMVSIRDSSVLGTLSLELNPKMSTQNSAGGILSYHEGDTDAAIAFEGAAFDRKSGELRAEIAIPGDSGSVAPLVLSGTIANGQFVGRIGVAGIPEYQASFELSRSSRSPSSVSTSASVRPLSFSQKGQIFRGKSSSGSPASLTLVARQGSPEQVFRELFESTSRFQAHLMMGGRQVEFTDAVFDDRTDSLVASSADHQLQCDGTLSGNAIGKWNCLLDSEKETKQNIVLTSVTGAARFNTASR